MAQVSEVVIRISTSWHRPFSTVQHGSTAQWCLLQARANARNIVGPNMLRAFAHHVACCCYLLEVVGWSLKLVKLQSQQVPTFLLFRGHRSVVQQCCVRLHSTSNNVAPAHAHYIPRIQPNTCEINMASEIENVPESFVFSSKDPTCCDFCSWAIVVWLKIRHKQQSYVVTCCERLHTSANIAKQETTLLDPTTLRVVASVCTGLKTGIFLRSLKLSGESRP